jgi:protein arginine kinase activator
MAKPEQCGNCKKPATIHLTQIVNNKVHKIDLCEDCPYKKSITESEGFSLADFLLKPGGLLESASDILECSECGFTPADFKKTGRFGCPACYRQFHEQLKPMLANMHKGIVHSGKIPRRALTRSGLRRRLRDLEKSLTEAVRAEQYEEAARLRDAISDMRGQLAVVPAVAEEPPCA